MLLSQVLPSHNNNNNNRDKNLIERNKLLQIQKMPFLKPMNKKKYSKYKVRDDVFGNHLTVDFIATQP